MYRRRPRTMLSGISGGIFLIGLAIAFFVGPFLPILFITLAFTSLIGSASSPTTQWTLWRPSRLCVVDGAGPMLCNGILAVDSGRLWRLHHPRCAAGTNYGCHHGHGHFRISLLE